MHLTTTLTTWAIQFQPIFAQDGSTQAASETTVHIPSNFNPVTPEGTSALERGIGADAEIAEQAGDAISQYVHDTLFKPIYDATTEFTNTVLEAISTYWMKLSVAPIFQPPTTNDQGITTPGTYDQLFTNTNQGALVQVSFAILMISLIIAGIRIMLTQRPDGFKDVLNGLLLLIIVATGGRAIMFLLASLTDSLATAFMKDAFDGKELGKAFMWIFGYAPDPTNESVLLSPAKPFGFLGGTILMGFMALSSLAQFFTMVARTVFLVTVFFFLEPIAAGAMSPTGIQRFKKTMGWIMAALFYKPAVGMLFWVAAKVANAGVDTGGTNHALLISIGIVLLSIFLPFPLVAICVPWVGNLGASSGGAGSAMNSIGSSIAGAVAPRAISVSGHAVKATAGAVGRTLSRSAKWLKGGSAEQNNPSGADPNAGGSGSGQFSEPTGGSGTGGGSSTKVVQTKTVSTGKQTAEVTKHATAGAKASAMPVATGGTARVAAGAAGGPIGVGVVAISTVASGTMNLVKSQTVRELNTMLPGGASGPGASSSSYQVPSGPVPRFDTGARGAKSTSVRGPERTAYQHQAPGAGPRKLY